MKALTLTTAVVALLTTTSLANAKLVKIDTAAGPITVSQEFAPKIKAFIQELADAGYHPKKVHCFSLSHSHVKHSLHKSGNACDFNQRGWGLTDRFMYHVKHIAAKYGLRDGCSFRDCGHIDLGHPIRTFMARSKRVIRRIAQATTNQHVDIASTPPYPKVPKFDR